MSSFRDGLFFLEVIVLLGAIVAICLCDFVLVPMHPMKTADRGGTVPYWLGAAQLEADGSCPVDYDLSSHRREQPLAPYSTPIE